MRGMVYHGQNRLEHWLIDQASSQPVTNFVRSSRAVDLDSSELKLHLPGETRFSARTVSDTSETTRAWRQVGSAFVRTGVAILLVPDPIPVVDEIIGAAFIAIGTTIVAFA